VVDTYVISAAGFTPATANVPENYISEACSVQRCPPMEDYPLCRPVPPGRQAIALVPPQPPLYARRTLITQSGRLKKRAPHWEALGTLRRALPADKSPCYDLQDNRRSGINVYDEITPTTPISQGQFL